MKLLLRGPLFANLLVCGPQLYPISLLSPGSLPTTMVTMRVRKRIKEWHLHCCRNCVALVPIHRQTKVTCHNFAEEDFRDFFLPGTNVDSLTDPDEATDPHGSTKPSLGTSDVDYAYFVSLKRQIPGPIKIFHQRLNRSDGGLTLPIKDLVTLQLFEVGICYGSFSINLQ